MDVQKNGMKIISQIKLTNNNEKGTPSFIPKNIKVETKITEILFYKAYQD